LRTGGAHAGSLTLTGFGMFDRDVRELLFGFCAIVIFAIVIVYLRQ